MRAMTRCGATQLKGGGGVGGETLLEVRRVHIMRGAVRDHLQENIAPHRAAHITEKC